VTLDREVDIGVRFAPLASAIRAGRRGRRRERAEVTRDSKGDSRKGPNRRRGFCGSASTVVPFRVPFRERSLHNLNWTRARSRN
jgi:hypothetical protein